MALKKIIGFKIQVPVSLNILSRLRCLVKRAPEFYGDLVYKFRKITGKNDFPYHFKKTIVRYKKIGYNIDVLRQTGHAWLLIQSSLTALLTSLIARR